MYTIEIRLIRYSIWIVYHILGIWHRIFYFPNGTQCLSPSFHGSFILYRPHTECTLFGNLITLFPLSLYRYGCCRRGRGRSRGRHRRVYQI